MHIYIYAIAWLKTDNGYITEMNGYVTAYFVYANNGVLGICLK